MYEGEKIVELLKDEKTAVVLYCDTSRLYYDPEFGDWVVRGGHKEHNVVKYQGKNLSVALVALRNKK